MQNRVGRRLRTHTVADGTPGLLLGYYSFHLSGCRIARLRHDSTAASREPSAAFRTHRGKTDSAATGEFFPSDPKETTLNPSQPDFRPYTVASQIPNPIKPMPAA